MRTYWRSDTLDARHGHGSLLTALVKYRNGDGRRRVTTGSGNLISSLTADGRHFPIIDLDYPHTYMPSSTRGHGHLYLDAPIPKWRWVALMVGLRLGRVIEPGFFWWSLRRGANFARAPWVEKEDR